MARRSAPSLKHHHPVLRVSAAGASKRLRLFLDLMGAALVGGRCAKSSKAPSQPEPPLTLLTRTLSPKDSKCLACAQPPNTPLHPPGRLMRFALLPGSVECRLVAGTVSW